MDGRAALLAAAPPWAGGGLRLNRPMVNQIPCGLLLRDRSETVIPFCLPWSSGRRHRERAVAASFAKTRPAVWSSYGDPLV
jgi:hypothetical protein